VKGRPITQARVEAVADPRNAITHAVAMEALCKGRDPSLIVNMDATQFQCAFDERNTKVMVLSKNHDCEQRSLVNTSTAFFIKYVSIYFANGIAAPPVFIVANDNISPGEFQMVTVKGMSHKPEVSEVGYLVFTHTRSANEAFFKWLFLHIVFPMIEKHRLDSDMDIADDPTGAADAIFTLDGEQQQVYAAADDEVLDAASSKMIHIVKLCASCSLIHQLCDVCPIYRKAKADMKQISEQYIMAGVFIEDRLRKALEPIQHILQLTSEQMKKLVTGLTKVVGVLRKNITTHHIMEGARKTSLSGAVETWDISVRPLPFRACTHAFTPAEMAIIYGHWPELLQQFHAEGMLSDVFLDTLNMPRLLDDDGDEATHVNREGFVEYRWRIACLNHGAIRQTLENRRAKAVEDARVAQEKVHAREVKKANKAVFLPVMESAKALQRLATETKAKIKEFWDSAVSNHKTAKNLNSRSRRIPTLHGLRQTCEETFARAQQFCKDISTQSKSIKEYLVSGSIAEATAANEIIENLVVQVSQLSTAADSDSKRSTLEINELTPSE
jgi:hypothetical protein